MAAGGSLTLKCTTVKIRRALDNLWTGRTTGSANDIRLDSSFGQRVDDADVGPTARRTAAERQADLVVLSWQFGGRG